MNNESLSKNDKIDFQIADHLMEAEQITAAEIARRTGGDLAARRVASTPTKISLLRSFQIIRFKYR